MKIGAACHPYESCSYSYYLKSQTEEEIQGQKAELWSLMLQHLSNTPLKGGAITGKGDFCSNVHFWVCLGKRSKVT